MNTKNKKKLSSSNLIYLLCYIETLLFGEATNQIKSLRGFLSKGEKILKRLCTTSKDNTHLTAGLAVLPICSLVRLQVCSLIRLQIHSLIRLQVSSLARTWTCFLLVSSFLASLACWQSNTHFFQYHFLHHSKLE